MRITLLTINTYADVQHILELGKALKDKGHDVSICAGLFLKTAVEDYGMKYCRMYIEIDNIVKEYEDRGEFEYIRRKNFDLHKFLRKRLQRKFEQLLNHFFIACKDAHIIIYDTNALGATDIAEFLGIPAVQISTLPNIYPINEYPFKDYSKKGFFNKRSYKAIKKREKDVIDIVNKFRVNVLGLPNRKSGANFYKINGWEIPIIYPFPKEFLSEVKSFGEKVHITGFNNSDFKKPLDKDMYSFLNAGEPPILVNFGYFPLEDPELFLEKLINAMYEVKCRFIFVLGETHMDLPNNPDILLISHTRKEGLLSRCKGFIHYGEFLNISDGFYYNVPQLLLPQTTNQKFWAKFLYSRNLTFKPLLEEKSTTKVLIDALRAFDNVPFKENQRKINLSIKEEKGIADSVKVVENTIVDYLDYYKDKTPIGMKRLSHFEINHNGQLVIKKEN